MNQSDAKIFITGASGQLAKSFSSIYHHNNLFLATKQQLDVTNRSDVLKHVMLYRPDIIFHFASLTRGDECTKNPELAYKINVTGTKNIVEAAKKIDCEVLFVSTNEVFDGKKRSSYIEEDIPNPITVAGKTKHAAEKLITENLKRFYIIRTSWLYSKWSKNFLHAVLDIAEKNKQVDLVMDEISSPTYSIDLAIALTKLINTKKFGVYHMANSGKASRLEYAAKAFELKGIHDISINAVKLIDYKRISKPPKNTPLKNVKARNLGIVLPRWDDALERFLKIS